MEAIDGYRRAALALQGLEPQEREWFLGQLDEDDRWRIAALLRETSGLAEVTAEETAKPAVPAGPTSRGDENCAAVIGGAHRDALGPALDGEPDWVIALMLAHCSTGAALRRYVDQLPRARFDRIHDLARQMPGSVKPRVRDVVLRGIAGRIERYDRLRPRTRDFESLLIDAVNE